MFARPNFEYRSARYLARWTSASVLVRTHSCTSLSLRYLGFVSPRILRSFFRSLFRHVPFTTRITPIPSEVAVFVGIRRERRAPIANIKKAISKYAQEAKYDVVATVHVTRLLRLGFSENGIHAADQVV